MVVRQNPHEVHPFLMWMKEHKIKKYLEVGVERGGMLCLVDQFLRACFNDVETWGIDITDCIEGYEEYHKQYPKCECIIVDRKVPWVPDKKFDLIFIDNNLKNHRMQQQAERLRPFAKYMAFHDVDIYKFGARNFWYGGEADSWGKEAYWYGRKKGSPGIGIVKC